jgi:methionyl aminopeptidase
VISIKTPGEVEIMAGAGKILAEILAELKRLIETAPALEEQVIENRAQELLSKFNVRSPFQGHEGYPFATCVSVNEEVVHGLPDGGASLKPGDLVGIDLGVVKDGLMVDAAITVPVGKPSAEDARLIRVAEEALELGIREARVGGATGDIGAAVQRHVEAAGFSVVRQLTGHGIGRSLHEEPSVANFGRVGEGPRLEAGMTICIEPMITAGGSEVTVTPGEWPVVTADGSRAAHVEHTVLVTADGPRILTEA